MLADDPFPMPKYNHATEECKTMSEILFKVLTVSGGLSGIAGLIMCWLVYKQFAAEKAARAQETEERKNLTRKLDELETEKFAELKKTVSEHIAKDRSQEILSELKHLSGSVARMIDRMERIAGSSAEQKAKIENHETYLENLNTIITGHINAR